MPHFSKQNVTAAMQDVFGDDRKRIAHALSVLSFAEKILQEEGGDADVVIAAAVLHDIGIHEAERKYGSNAGRYQEIEGPPIAKRILESFGAKENFISEVCDIIAHHHSPRENESLNYQILYDADLIVNVRDDVPPERRAALSEKMKRMFFTSTGLRLARETLLGSGA